MLLSEDPPQALRQTDDNLVGGGGGEGRGREADALVGGVEDTVETLEEDLAIDEIETLAGGGADVVNDEVDGAGAATDGGVQGALRQTAECPARLRTIE